jgi:hypothetical protein
MSRGLPYHPQALPAALKCDWPVQLTLEASAMQLPPDQVERFYAIWLPLMLFVNRRLKVVPTLLDADPSDSFNPKDIVPIRDALWADDSLREVFIQENPAQLSPLDLEIVASWQHRVAGPFFIYKLLKKHALFIKDSTVYGVAALASTFEEMVPFLPFYVQTWLIPFEERIIYDSLWIGHNISFGSGYRRSLDATYKDAKERNAIITTLGPTAAVAPGEKQKVARSTNTHVLDAFRAHLYAAGLSSKVVDRDLAQAAAFAEFLMNQKEPLSLRDFGATELRAYLAQVPTGAAALKGRPGQVLTSMKRFLRFLRDTQRMDFDAAGDALEMLRGQQ